VNLEYIVICRDDQKDNGSPGDYTLATRTVFPDKGSAEAYASAIAVYREAIVVGGLFGELRHDFEERFKEPSESPQLAMTDCEKHGHTVGIRHEAGVVCRNCFILASRGDYSVR
jgi:hypothetical protein